MKKSYYTNKKAQTTKAKGALSPKQQYRNKLSCRMIDGHHHQRGRSCKLAQFSCQPLRQAAAAAAGDDNEHMMMMKAEFGEDEEDLITRLHALLGNNRWSLIAGRLPGRGEVEVRNYWNEHLKQKLINNGIDPDDHRVDQTIDHQIQSICNSSTCSINNLQQHSDDEVVDNEIKSSS